MARAPKNGVITIQVDVKEFLDTMQAEHRADHQTLVNKIDGGFATMTKRFDEHEDEDTRLFNSFEIRVGNIEGWHKLAKWFAGAGVIGLITFIFDLLKNHLFVGPHP